MTDTSEMRFLYGTIAKKMNKNNCRSEYAASNSGITGTKLKFNRRRSEAPHKV